LRTFGSWSGALPVAIEKSRVEEREEHLPVLRQEDYYQEEKGKVEESKELDVEAPSQSHASDGTKIKKEKSASYTSNVTFVTIKREEEEGREGCRGIRGKLS
jgi:hypothetical protein